MRPRLHVRRLPAARPDHRGRESAPQVDRRAVGRPLRRLDDGQPVAAPADAAARLPGGRRRANLSTDTRSRSSFCRLYSSAEYGGTYLADSDIRFWSIECVEQWTDICPPS